MIFVVRRKLLAVGFMDFDQYEIAHFLVILTYSSSCKTSIEKWMLFADSWNWQQLKCETIVNGGVGGCCTCVFVCMCVCKIHFDWWKLIWFPTLWFEKSNAKATYSSLLRINFSISYHRQITIKLFRIIQQSANIIFYSLVLHSKWQIAYAFVELVEAYGLQWIYG